MSDLRAGTREFDRRVLPMPEVSPVTSATLPENFRF
jgi:hypothetical protein